jgi:hypothetical protein
MWLPITGKTPKGKKPQGRQPVWQVTAGGGSRLSKLWRGAKGQERIFRKIHLFRILDSAKTSKAMVRSKRERRTNKGASAVEHIL